MKPEKIRSSDGFMVTVEGYVWSVPTLFRALSPNTVITSRYDWSNYPPELRETLLLLGKMVVRFKGVRVFGLFQGGISHLVEFFRQSNNLDKKLHEMTETDWGAFAEWLNTETASGSQLILDTRRGYFTGLKLAIQLAIDNEVTDYNEAHITAIERVMRRKFRDSNLLAAERGARRAWSEEERERLMEIVRLEWLAWKEWYRQHQNRKTDSEVPDLLTVVAVYLCFEETVRPEEINVMRVEDIDFENNKLLVHASNKEEGMISFGPIAKALLKALVSWGATSRDMLGTTSLFVNPLPKPRMVGTQKLTRGFRRLLLKYADQYPIDRYDAKLSDGRKTLGSIMASRSEDPELVRLTLRHESQSTMQLYYIRQGKEQLSKNVSEALRQYATRLSMAYNEADVTDEVSELFKQFPNHDTPYGSCSDEGALKSGCDLAIHCGECPKLIPMASKLDNYIVERDMYLQLAEQAKKENNDRSYENRIATAGMLEGHIINIQRKLQEVNGNGENATK